MEEQDTIELLKEASLCLARYDRRVMRGGERTPPENRILGYLFTHEEETFSATDIHLRSGVSKPAISAVIKSLKRKGYLCTDVQADDERRKRIRLTPRAYQAREQVERELKERSRRLCHGIPEQELRVFRKALYQIIHNIRQEFPAKEECT